MEIIGYILIWVLVWVFNKPLNNYFANTRIGKLIDYLDKLRDDTPYYVRNRKKYTDYGNGLTPKQQKHNEDMDRLNKEELVNQSRLHLEAEQAFLKGLQDKFGKEMGLKVKNKELCVGMTKEMVIEFMFKPSHKKQSVSRGKVREEWFYYGYVNRLGNMSYRFRIVIVNGLVQGWNDIK